ncbi:MAG TPA: ATP-binding protein [Candidatus Polarisedimenticolaceae bacterium]
MRHIAGVRSLSVRLLLALLGTVGVALTAYAVISFRSAEAGFNSFVLAEGQHTSALIRRATQDAMLLNRKSEVQSALERLARGSTITAVRIFGPDGRIAMSSSREEVGRRVARTEAPCSLCHASGVRPPERTSNGPGLRHLSVIPNDASCVAASCHRNVADQPIVGVLDVEMSSGPLESTLRAARRRTIWTMASLILVTGAISAVFIHRVVHRPVLRLQEGTRRIARGDLDTRIEVSGRHELAELAAAFNTMAEDLQVAREESVHWSRRLEEKVVEKTEELQRTQRQVLHMEKMASLGKLAATVAHELNNPLSSILTFARLVERELPSHPIAPEPRQEMSEWLRLIQDECARCGNIVRDLLLFSRRSGTERAPFDVHQVAERSLALTRHHLEMRRIELRRELEAVDPVVVGDAAQIEQALVALIVNAVEAMSGPGAAGGELGVRVDDDPEEVRVAVADTGVGIHPEVLPHIFEPFFSTKNKESGVGLGLAVVYGIVQGHGGTIDVESNPGRGSVFRLRLPRKPRPGAAQERGLR